MRIKQWTRFGSQLRDIMTDGQQRPTSWGDMKPALEAAFDTNGDGRLSKAELVRARDEIDDANAHMEESVLNVAEDWSKIPPEQSKAINGLLDASQMMSRLSVGEPYTLPPIVGAQSSRERRSSLIAVCYGPSCPEPEVFDFAEVVNFADVVNQLDVDHVANFQGTLSVKDARRLVTSLAPQFGERPEEAKAFYVALAKKIDSGEIDLSDDAIAHIAPGLQQHAIQAGKSQAVAAGLREQFRLLAVLTSGEWAWSATCALDDALAQVDGPPAVTVLNGG